MTPDLRSGVAVDDIERDGLMVASCMDLVGFLCRGRPPDQACIVLQSLFVHDLVGSADRAMFREWEETVFVRGRPLEGLAQLQDMQELRSHAVADGAAAGHAFSSLESSVRR